MRFLESAKLVVGTFFVGVVMEVAKQELALPTLEASPVQPVTQGAPRRLRRLHATPERVCNYQVTHFPHSLGKNPLSLYRTTSKFCTIQLLKKSEAFPP